jgi:hypothetical protein
VAWPFELSGEARPEWVATTETYAGVRAERCRRDARREARPELIVRRREERPSQRPKFELSGVGEPASPPRGEA